MNNHKLLPLRFRLIGFKKGKNAGIIFEKYLAADELKRLNEDEEYNIYYVVNKVADDSPENPRRYFPDGFVMSCDEVICLVNAVFIEMDLSDYVDRNNKESREKFPYKKRIGNLFMKGPQYHTKEEFISMINTFPLPPSKILDSGNGIHVYWYVNNSPNLFPVEKFKGIQSGLIKYFNTDIIKNPSHVMRYEGTINHHEKYKQRAFIVSENPQNIYTYNEIYEVLKDFVEEEQKKPAKIGRKREPVLIDGATIPECIPKSFENTLKVNRQIRKMFKRPESLGKSRSEQDFKLACILGKSGYARNDIYSIIAQSKKASEKKNRVTRSKYVEATVNNAINEIKREISECKQAVKPPRGSSISHRVSIPTLTGCAPPCVKTQAEEAQAWISDERISLLRTRIRSDDLSRLISESFDNVQPGTVKIIPTSPGGGKTTSIEILCRKILLEGKGAIVVKEFKRDLNELEASLGGENKAYHLMGFDEELC